MILKNKQGYVLLYAIGIIAVLMILASSLTQATLIRSNWATKQVQYISESNLARMRVEAAATDLKYYFQDFKNEQFKYLYQLNNEFYDDTVDADGSGIFIQVMDKYGVIIRDLTKETCTYPNDETKSPCYLIDEDIQEEDYSYTYAYDIVYETANVIAQKQFFVSMIPSFLYFGLGSRTDVTINGGAYIDGDIYLNHHLHMSNTANYLIAGVPHNVITHNATVAQNTNLYYSSNNYKLFNCHQYEGIACYDTVDNNFKMTDLFVEQSNLESSFTTTAPILKTYSDRYLDVNFDASFIYYLNDAIFPTHDWYDEYYRIELLENVALDDRLEGIIDQLLNIPYEGLTIVDDIADIVGSDVDSDIPKSVLFDGDLSFTAKQITNPNIFESYYNEVTNEIYYRFKYNKKKWIIVLGDLYIENYDNVINPILIDANFLVFGDITVTGNVQFNSTTYVLGDTTIHNASINFVDERDVAEYNLFKDNQLVLLTRGDIQFSKINEFVNNFEGMTVDFDGKTVYRPNIRGFFYANGSIQVYTLNSYLVIEGGLFAQDHRNLLKDANNRYILDENENPRLVPESEYQYIIITGNDPESPGKLTDSIGLLVNSFRGAVYPNSESFDGFTFVPNENYRQSRFVLKHSTKIIETQPKGLPLNIQLNFVFDNVTIKKK